MGVVIRTDPEAGESVAPGQRIGYLAQNGQADRAPVDAADVAAVGAQFAGQHDELVAILVQPLVLQHGAQGVAQSGVKASRPTEA